MMVPPDDLNGLVRLRRDLMADGLTDNQIARLVRAGILHRVRYGAYVPHERWAAASPEDRHRLLCRAILATADESTALTHVSSVIERGIPVWGFPLDVAHTTRVVTERAGRRSRDWIPHRGALRDEDVEIVNGVPISRAARSAVEVSTIAGVEASLVVANRLLHTGAMKLEEFADEVERCRYWPGSLTSDLVLRLANPRLESVGEDRFSYLAYHEGLPRPEPQYEVFDADGTIVGRVDFAWPEFGVFLEFDGKVKYERYRREGETLDEYLMREKRRELDICQATGWTCIRITWTDLNRPRQLAARIRAILSATGRRAG